MCGIAGVRRFGPEPIREEQIKFLLCSLEMRGADATGVALVNPGDPEIHVCKSDMPASQFVTTKLVEKFLNDHLKDETETVLLHTRYATQGPPKINGNNHPLYSGTSAVVHNGVIMNDDFLFSDMKLKREAETDSDIIRAIVDKEGLTKGGLKKLSKMSGSCAAAIVSQEEPGKLMLLRSGSPLVMAATQHQLLFASRKESLHLAVRPWIRRFGMDMQSSRTDVTFTPVRDHSGFIFGPDGLEWHDKFETCYRYQTPDYARTYDEFDTRQNKWKDAVQDRVQCPNNKCGQWLKLPARLKNEPLYDLICNQCSEPLGEKPSPVA
jgi:asparagine synthetase B (glutamine-hydrolysing)